MLWLTTARSPVPGRHVAHLPEALLLELGVPDGQHLVDDQDLRSMWAATANASRMYIPLLYRLTGVSRNRSTSLNATISSNFAGDLRRASRGSPVQVDVLPPGQLGVEPGPDLQQAADPAVDLADPWSAR
jgi:hypothetical protein